MIQQVSIKNILFVLSILCGAFHLSQAATLVSHWNLNEEAGVTAIDSAGSNYDMPLYNGINYATGDVPFVRGNESSLIFDGIDDYAQANGLNETLNGISVSCWVKHNYLGTSYQRYVSTSNEGAVIRYRNNNGNKDVQFFVRINGNLETLTAANILNIGEWFHLAGTYDGSSLKLYVNGALLEQRNITGTIEPISFLRVSHSIETMNGWIDDIRIYDGALTSNEIGDLAHKLNIGAYYYPWYGPVNHDVMRSVRGGLNVNQGPLLGQYDSSDENVINTHINWARDSGIDFFGMSWFGPGDYGDTVLRDNYLNASDLGDFQFCILFETPAGRLMGPHIQNHRITFDNGGPVEQALIGYFDYLAQNYLGHPNYFRINNKPVVYMYVTHILAEPFLDVAFNNMRNHILNTYGYELYIVGDEVDPAKNPSDYRIQTFDAITSYTMYTGRREHAMPNSTGLCYSDDIWYLENTLARYTWFKEAADRNNTEFIPCALTAFNNRKHALDRDLFTLPLRRGRDDVSKYSFFEGHLDLAGAFVDNRNRVMMVTSWNEWHEDTQLEPTVGTAGAEPYDYTTGLEFEPYGFDLLNVLSSYIDNYNGQNPLVKEVDLKITEVCMEYNGDPNAQYIEIYNPGNSAVNLNGMKITARTKNSEFDGSPYINIYGVIQPNSYFLITTNGYPGIADHRLGTNDFAEISKDNGQFALRDTQGMIVDAIGWGYNSNFIGLYTEGNSFNFSSFPSANQSISRTNINIDTDDNSADFSIQNQSPISGDHGTNQAPVFTSTPILNVSVGEQYNYMLTATDADGDALTFSMDAASYWLNNSGALLSGIPQTRDVASYQVVCYVSDGKVTVDQLFTINVNHSMESGLAAYWKMDEGSGNSVADESGKAGSMLLSNGTTFTGTDLSINNGNPYSLSFDGVDDYAEADGISSSAAQVTLSCWVKHDSLGNGIQRYVSANNEAAVIRYNGTSGNNINFYIKVDGNFKHLNATDLLVSGQWFHIVGTWDSKVQKLYVNGVLVQQQDIYGWMEDYSSVRVSNSGEPMDGLLDDVRVYHRALSQLEIDLLSDYEIIANVYENWKAINNISDDMADEDNDGLNNLMEFALGGNPRVAEKKSPQVGDNGANFEFKFHRGEESVTYRVEKSNDLVNWIDHVTVSDSHGLVGTDCTVPVSTAEMNNGKLFLRLKVEN